ncbi:MAG: TIGR01212 family radical SAM protein [Thermoguttaceae bacterium]|nr:TIGR01212 family radical SAM protein [Thermoguttaceae bacterium]
MEKTGKTGDGGVPFWRRSGARYFPLSAYFKREFGGVVRKISVDAHFSCPNIDGTVGRGGCIYCDAVSFSPGRFFGLDDLDAQLDDGIRQLRRRFDVDRFIAYFQPSTNTHAPLDELRRKYEVALRRPEVVGIAIGTRPDALGDSVLDLLAEIAREKWLALEIGLQSANDATLKFFNRGHDCATFVDAVRRAKERCLRLGTHVILGAPGETRDDMRRTARLVADLGFHSLKLHHLYVVRNTKLARLWEVGEVEPPRLDDYAEAVVDFLELQSPETVIERISGEASEPYLLAPDWTAKKHAARNAVDVVFRRRDSWQGKFFQNAKITQER